LLLCGPCAIVSPFRELDRDPAFDGNPWIRLDTEDVSSRLDTG
jgi:hypothetical protein